jgi:hypothetical protein
VQAVQVVTGSVPRAALGMIQGRPPEPGEMCVRDRAAPPVRHRGHHGRDRRLQTPVVVRGHRVERRAHERGLHQAPVRERAVHGGGLQPVDAGQEPEVGRRRLLRLEPAHGAGHRDGIPRIAPEQALPGERRSVQRRGREDGIAGHQDRVAAVSAVRVRYEADIPRAVRRASAISDRTGFTRAVGIADASVT